MSVTRPGRAVPAAAVIGVMAGGAACGGDARCGPDQAMVERVIDGDTIVAGGATIRYVLVDAPEVSGQASCYGANAAKFNRDLVLGQIVQLTYEPACQDRFGRTLAYVSVAGQDVNRLLVERGYACVLHIPPDGDARAAEFEAIQAAARDARRGLWGACDPAPCK